MPPGGVALSVVTAPTQVMLPPVMGDGYALTVTTIVVKQEAIA